MPGVQLRQAEVQDLRVPALGHEGVRGLDVAVDDALGVSGVQGVGDLDRQLQQLRRLDGLARDAVLESLALQQLHADEGLAFVLVDVVNGADVGMIEGGGGLGLSLEPLQGDLVVGESLGEELQRNVTSKAGVFCLVDHTHPPAAELLDDPVVGDALADHAARFREYTPRRGGDEEPRTTRFCSVVLLEHQAYTVPVAYGRRTHAWRTGRN